MSYSTLPVYLGRKVRGGKKCTSNASWQQIFEMFSLICNISTCALRQREWCRVKQSKYSTARFLSGGIPSEGQSIVGLECSERTAVTFRACHSWLGPPTPPALAMLAAPAVQGGSLSAKDETASRDKKRAHMRVAKEEREEERRRNRKKAELERVRQAALKASKVCDARNSDVRSLIVVSVRAKRPAKRARTRRKLSEACEAGERRICARI